MISIDMHIAFSILVFPLRVINFLFAFWWYWMERMADSIVFFFVKTEYVRKGKCNRCGRCCRLLAMEMPARVSSRDWLVWLVSKWHSAVLNFEIQGRDARWLVYRCRYYYEKDGKAACRIYHFRHRLCRFYPTQKLYGHPKLNPDCGFSFVRRDGKPSFDEVLREKRKQTDARCRIPDTGKNS
jgi:Fe-S-cluster containining protein